MMSLPMVAIDYQR